MITVMISTDLPHQNEHFTVRNPLDYQRVVPFMLSSYISKFGRLLLVFSGCFTLLFLLPQEFVPWRCDYVIENRTPVMEFHHEYRWSSGLQGNVLAW